MKTIKIEDLEKENGKFHIGKLGDYGDKYKRYGSVIVFVELGDRPGPFGNGEGTISDDFRWRRNHDHLPPSQILELVKPVLVAAGYQPLSISYSDKAGCSMCPCSPGYLVKVNSYSGYKKVLRVKHERVIEQENIKAEKERDRKEWENTVTAAFCA